MGFNPMKCFYLNFGELTLFLKYFIHPLIHHQLKNTYHVSMEQLMQGKMLRLSFGIQKFVETGIQKFLGPTPKLILTGH